MRWQQGRRSENVEDRRDEGGGMFGGGGMPGGKPAIGGLGLLIVIVLSLIFGVNPMTLLEQLGQTGAGSVVQTGDGGAPGAGMTAEEAATAAARPTSEVDDFLKVVLGSTEDVWGELFSASRLSYRNPTLVLYSDEVQSACGINSAATGPFYCPNDQKLYLDTSFLVQLRQLGAPGDFAFAYVIAHEIGHHVQHELNIDAEVQSLQQQSSQADANRLSVLLELQADCLAGVWAFHANQERSWLEPGDVEEGLQAAAAVGDDRLMKMSGRRVVREAFTHGSSEERVQWLKTGLASGDFNSCDTFKAAGLRP